MSPQHVLVIHNAYRHRGGEDSVVDAEVALLRSRGHEVTVWQRSNDELTGVGPARAALDTLWSRETHKHTLKLIDSHRPELVHVHNTFAVISPAVYWACAQRGVPVVQTLHNFRLLCPQAMFLRNGRVCESCLGRAPLAAIRHSCYHGSMPQTAVLSGMLMLHRGLGTWTHKVHRYIALNEFCRGKFVEGGLPADRIAVKPNFVLERSCAVGDRQGLIFAGRLSPEKGLAVLARAVSGLPAGTVNVFGSGPEGCALASCDAIRKQGFQDSAAVHAAMGRAIALVFPSIWYETFGLVVIEAFAAGTPVIGSHIGGVPELVTDGKTGLLVEPGNSRDLAEKLRWALENPLLMAEMGRKARKLYENRFTSEVNYQQLMKIYSDAALEAKKQKTSQ